MYITLYGYGTNQLSNGLTARIDILNPVPTGFTPVEPPVEIPNGKYAFYSKSTSEWSLIDYVPNDVLPTPRQPQINPLTRLEFEIHAQTAAGLTDAEFLAALQDPNLALLWHRLSIATQIDRDSDLTKNGLTSTVSAGHLTDAQVVIINDTWPTE